MRMRISDEHVNQTRRGFEHIVFLVVTVTIIARLLQIARSVSYLLSLNNVVSIRMTGKTLISSVPPYSVLGRKFWPHPSIVHHARAHKLCTL